MHNLGLYYVIKKETKNINYRIGSIRFFLEKVIFLIYPIILSIFLVFGFITKKFDILAFLLSFLTIFLIIVLIKLTVKVSRNKEHLQCFICNNNAINKYKGFTRIFKIPLCEEHYSQVPKEIFQKENEIYRKYAYKSLILSIIFPFVIYSFVFAYGLEIGINGQSLENLIISVVLIDFLFLPIQILLNVFIAKRFNSSIQKVN